MDKQTAKRSKDEMFRVLLTDAIASTYNVPGLRADKAVTVDTLRARMDAAGLLEDCAED
ncbi:MAG: hypothetical protein HYY78_10465 [Betaproteobacteria bacterium]|nr:hypothetical protein [Betaproteobacteria bacterium]